MGEQERSQEGAGEVTRGCMRDHKGVHERSQGGA